MDDISSLRALLQTVDRTLSAGGTDPATVTDEDKILIAAQYVETAEAREKMALTILPEDTYAQLFGSASGAPRNPLRQELPVFRLSRELPRGPVVGGEPLAGA